MKLQKRRERLGDAAAETTTLRIAFVGLVDDLLLALDNDPGLAADGLAEITDTDPTYVERWLDAAYAWDLVDNDGDGHRLTELGEAFLPNAPATLMPLAIQSVLSARLADRLAELVRTGEQPGEEILSEFENVVPWFGDMLEAKFRPYFREHVLPELDLFADVDARGGRVLDLGCGNGWYLRELAASYEGLEGVGLDAMSESIDAARRSARDANVAGRLDFEVGDIFEYRAGEPFDAVVLNRTLHHVWSRRDEVFATVETALDEEGWLVAWEPAWPEERSQLRDPERRMLGMRNLAEHAMGNRLLQPSEIEEAFAAHDFQAEIRRLDAVETLFVGRRV